MGTAVADLRRPLLGREAIARAVPPLAGACLVAIIACGAEIAVSAAAPHSSLLAHTHGGHPAWLSGPLAGLGHALRPLTVVLLVTVMAAAYLALLPLATSIRARWVIGTVVLLHVVFALAPPIRSDDVFSYIAYARLAAVHGLDPYNHSPALAPHDAVFAFTHWRHAPTDYGPLFTLGSYPLGHLSVAGALWWLKGIAAAASLGCVALVWRIAGQLGHSPARAAAVFGLNPILLMWTVGGAHNDLLMLLAALAAVTLVLDSREALGGATAVAAVAIKASAGLALPFVLLGARRRWRALGGCAAAAVAIGATAAAAFPSESLAFVGTLRRQQALVAWDSVPAELARLAGLPGITHSVRLACEAIGLGAVVLLVVRVWRGVSWVSACGWAFVAAVVTTSFLLGWYAVWPLPFAAATRNRRLLAVTLLLQAYFVVNHVPGFTIPVR